MIELGERVPLTAKQTLFCFDILLTSCKDYKTDKRGDTGSWCRSAALHGMERLLYATFRIIPMNIPSNIPSPNNVEERSSKNVPSHESLSIGTTVMTSLGLGKTFSFSGYSSIKYNESTVSDGILGADSKDSVLIQYPTGSLGYFFTVDAFQERCLPLGIVSVHRAGVQILKGQTHTVVALPQSLPQSQGSILESNSFHQVNEKKDNDKNKGKYDEDRDSGNIFSTILSTEESTVLVPKIIAAMLKQLCEKLDSVRGIAGNCLENILCSRNPFIPFITDRDVLLKIIEESKNQECDAKMERKERSLNEHGEVENGSQVGTQNRNEGVNEQCNLGSSSSSSSSSGNASESSSSSSSSSSDTSITRNEWSNPNYVFPLVTTIMKRSPFYFKDILSGLVVSVGGLSEQVVKESSDALLKLCTSWTEEKNISNIEKTANSLLLFFFKFKSDDRVIIPLLKTTEYLLRSGVLNLPALRPVCCSFYTDLIECIGVEQKGTSDVGKIRTCVDLYLLLLQVEEPVRSTALKNMLLLLGHKVRTVLYYFLCLCM